MKSLRKAGILLLISLFCFRSARAFTEFTLTEIQPTASPGKGIEYLEDKFSVFTAAEAYTKPFFLFKGGKVNFGLSNSTYWLRFKITNQTPDDRLLLKIAYPFLDSIDVYMMNEGYPVLHKSGGDRYIMGKAEIRNPGFLFFLPVPKGVSTEILIRVRTLSSIQVPILVATDGSMLRRSEDNSLWYGIYYGVLMVMILYNLFLYFSLREKMYIYYTICIFFSLSFFLIFYGHARYYFWPDSIVWNQRAVHLAMGLLSASSAAFAIVFLELRKSARWMYYTMMGIVVFGVAYSVFCFAVDIHTSTKIATWLIMFNAIAMLFSGLASLISGYRSARLFVLAWTAYLAGALLLIFRNLGMLPSNAVTSNFANIGSVLEVILLSLALADKYRLLKAEKEKAQEALLEVQKNVNLTLEKKVKERTQQLQDETEKTEKLLLNILPAPVADELKNTGKFMAKRHDNVTVMFTDFVNFTRIAENMIAEMLVFELDAYFKKFDEIIANYGIEKIKTIGDAYLCVAGLHGDKKHAENMCQAALEIRNYMQQVNQDKNPGEFRFDLRLGIHSGDVVAGVVGRDKFAYDIWGDSVNIAARMEQNGKSGKINISNSTYLLVKDLFDCEPRGSLPVKNKGDVEMYFLEPRGVLATQS